MVDSISAYMRGKYQAGSLSSVRVNRALAILEEHGRPEDIMHYIKNGWATGPHRTGEGMTDAISIAERICYDYRNS